MVFLSADTWRYMVFLSTFGLAKLLVSTQS